VHAFLIPPAVEITGYRITARSAGLANVVVEGMGTATADGLVSRQHLMHDRHALQLRVPAPAYTPCVHEAAGQYTLYVLAEGTGAWLL